MTICDICLKENRPLIHCYLSLLDKSCYGSNPILIDKDYPLICEDCTKEIQRLGLFKIIKGYLNPSADGL